MAHSLKTAIEGTKTLLAILEAMRDLPELQRTGGYPFTVSEISAKIELYNHQLQNLVGSSGIMSRRSFSTIVAGRVIRC
jgi:hypothetical protein